MTLPNFLIIGGMRCGTTSLASYLRSHSQAFVSIPKEIRFFDRRFDLGVDWYAGHFAASGGAIAIGEASPGYMYSEGALQNMSSIIPGARLVAIIRNPVDRAYSHYWHRRARGVETLSFSGALAAEASRLVSGDRRQRYDFSYFDRGRYLDQLQTVCRYFPRSSLLILLTEDLAHHPNETYRDLCTFLGIEPEPPPARGATEANRYTGFKSIRLQRQTQRWPRTLRRIIGRINTQPESYPPMDPRIREQLLKRYDAENRALKSWLGRDLPGWDE